MNSIKAVMMGVVAIVIVAAAVWSPVYPKDKSGDYDFRGYTPVNGSVTRDLMENTIVNSGAQATFTGNVMGNIAVMKGGTAVLKGPVTGNITNMGIVRIYGTMNGTIRNRGGEVYIYGMVTGDIYKKGGKVVIDKKASLIGTQKDE
jgi:hypothetical protein